MLLMDDTANCDGVYEDFQQNQRDKSAPLR